eukprot:gnl/TRDRNA2_/TRDRNA2_59042_c0_seq1.p1 gnl/TRDRNA2_/TRDRNA2_59042_c0~~gnl/TRDRNA2_/TRDRNA2_59042_c0_seq1.p1  ORF type:complete len:131 (-),score=17.79 gnl/TRDRNA2_/TRDRNA2_59042_c0_seq1:182-520(-)
MTEAPAADSNGEKAASGANEAAAGGGPDPNDPKSLCDPANFVRGQGPGTIHHIQAYPKLYTRNQRQEAKMMVLNQEERNDGSEEAIRRILAQQTKYEPDPERWNKSECCEIL